MPDRPYMTPAEVAAKLGHRTAWFHTNYARLVRSGMPASVTPFGQRRFDRQRMQVWLDPKTRPPAPANDSTELTPAQLARAAFEADIADWRTK